MLPSDIYPRTRCILIGPSTVGIVDVNRQPDPLGPEERDSRCEGRRCEKGMTRGQVDNATIIKQILR